MTNTQQLKNLAACPTIYGDLMLQSITASAPTGRSSPKGSFTGERPFNLGSIREIKGSLVLDSVNNGNELSNFAPSLSGVTRDITVRNMQNLGVLGFDSVTIMHSLTLENVSFSNATDSILGKGQFNGTTQLGRLNLTNTRVTGVEWTLSEIAPSARLSVYAHGNPHLQQISFFHLIEGNSVEVDVANNSHSLALNFPSIASLTPRINDTQSFRAQGLKTISPPPGNMTYRMWFSHNSIVDLVIPSVTTISGSLSVTDNLNMRRMDASQLGTVEDLSISDNANLIGLSMTGLTTVAQWLNISGPFQGNLSLGHGQINGGGTIDIRAYGSQKVTDCKRLEDLAGAGVTVTCKNVPTPAGVLNPSSTSSSGGQGSAGTSGGLSTGAKAGIGVGVGLGVLAIAGALIFLLCARRRKKSHSASREVGAEYSKAQQAGEESNSTAPISYSMMPYQSMSGVELQEHEIQEQQSSRRPQSSLLGDEWTPPEQEVPSADGRVELEEQQGMRHEMDARSLPDMDLDDDDEEDTRSLNDIERIHAQR